MFDVQVGGSDITETDMNVEESLSLRGFEGISGVSGLEAAVWTAGHLRFWQLAPLNFNSMSSFQPCRK